MGPRKHFQITKGREGECSSRVSPSVCAWSCPAEHPRLHPQQCSIAAPRTRLQPCPARGTHSRHGRALLPRKGRKKTSPAFCHEGDGLEIPDPRSPGSRTQGKVYLKDLAHAESTCGHLPLSEGFRWCPWHTAPPRDVCSVKDTVTTDEEDDEIYTDDHAWGWGTTICHYAIIHDSIPVFTC